MSQNNPTDYPNDLSPVTSGNRIAVGNYTDDGTDAHLELDTGIHIVGQHGCGKTMLLQNITASLVRRPDTLVWHLDRNNGSLSASWAYDQDEPVVDWIAVNDDEALKMVQAAIRIAGRRRTRYLGEMVRANQTVLPARPDLPRIVILVDGADDTVDGDGPAGKLGSALQTLRRVGPAMNILVVLGYVRGTADTMPSQVKATSRAVFCGKVKEAAEAAHVLGTNATVDPSVLDRGQFFYQAYGSPIRTVDTYRIMPQQIRAITAVVREYRVDTHLDKPSVEAAGSDYTDRWTNPSIRQWLAFLHGDDNAFPEEFMGR